MDDDRSRDAAIWDAGYATGYQHAMEGRPNVLPDATWTPVINLRARRMERAAETRAHLHAN